MLNKKNIVIVTVVLVFAIIAGWFFSTRVYSLHGNKIEKIAINNKIFYAEVVLSNEKLEKGLGKRNGLCDSCAMLFEFSSPGKYSFWMKGMRFPLDIIWIRNGEIVHIEKNVSEKFSGILSPPFDSDSVLEINAGIIDKLEIKIGDRVVGS